MEYHNVVACWKRNPAELQAVFAQQPLPQLLGWADAAMAAGDWTLGSVLFTAAGIKVQALNAHCIRRAAQQVKPEST